MTSNEQRAAEVIAVEWPNGRGVRTDDSRELARALVDAGLLAEDLPEPDPTHDRQPSWVYDHPEVWTSPYRLGGVPCVRGTRVPVENIFDLLTDPEGDFRPLTAGEIVRDFFPSVRESQVVALRAAAEYAERRGQA